MSTRRSFVLGLGCVATLGGCATTRWDEPLADGTVVSLSVTKSEVATTRLPIVNLSASGTVATGMGSGTAAGLGIGLTCGPFIPLCLAVTIPLGAAAGALSGVVVATAAELPDATATRVRDRWARVLATRDPLADLTATLNEQARAHWTLAPEGGGTLVKIELKDIELASTREQQIGFILRAGVSLQAGAGQARVAPKPRVVEVVAPTVSLAQWLDDGDPGIDTKWRDANQQLAAQIVGVLAAR